jgi:cell division protein FtsN
MIILPVNEGPSALALETPEYGAAETSVALADAEPEAKEIPAIDSPAGLSPGSDAGTVELAEAEEKADETPDIVGPAGLVPGSDVPTVELAEAEDKARERPLADAKAGVSPYGGGTDPALAEAQEQKPETTAVKGAPAETAAVVDPLDTPKEYIVALEPTGPKPPVVVPVAPAPVTAAVVEPVKPAPPVAVPVKTPTAAVDVLEKGRFYIQIGAYGSESTAKDAALSVGKNFGAVVQKVSAKGKDTWRVFVGPLTRDESGVTLVRVRALGFKDAFVKSGG